MGFENFGKAPCCVAVNKYSEYAAAKNLMSPIGITIKEETDKTEVRSKISPKRFIEVGAAILPAAKINHQNDMAGKYMSNPFVKKSLRVLVDS